MEIFPLRYRLLITLGSLSLSLFLAACGAAQAPSWPGLAANDQLVFVANLNNVHALKLDTLKREWVFPSRLDPNTGVVQAETDATTGPFQNDPAVSGDLLVVGTEGPTGSYSGALFALDANTGTQKWCLVFDSKGADRLNKATDRRAPYNCLVAQTQPVSSAADNRPIAGTTIANDMVYFGLASGIFYAVDAASGTEKWAFTQPTRDVWAAPAVTTDTVYFTSLDHHVYALDAATGTLRWAKDLGAASAGTPVVDAGRVYIGSFGNQFLALDANTGDTQWVYTTTNWVWSGATLNEGVLYFTDVAGMVYAVEAETGQAKWTNAIGQPTRARPAVAEGMVLVTGRTGTLFALDIADGVFAWQQKIEGQLLASPLAVGTDVLVAPYNTGGNLFGSGGGNLLEARLIASGAQREAFKP